MFSVFSWNELHDPLRFFILPGGGVLVGQHLGRWGRLGPGDLCLSLFCSSHFARGAEKELSAFHLPPTSRPLSQILAWGGGLVMGGGGAVGKGKLRRLSSADASPGDLQSKQQTWRPWINEAHLQ